jgi:hypothetical protein
MIVSITLENGFLGFELCPLERWVRDQIRLAIAGPNALSEHGSLRTEVVRTALSHQQ